MNAAEMSLHYPSDSQARFSISFDCVRARDAHLIRSLFNDEPGTDADNETGVGRRGEVGGQSTKSTSRVKHIRVNGRDMNEVVRQRGRKSKRKAYVGELHVGGA